MLARNTTNLAIQTIFLNHIRMMSITPKSISSSVDFAIAKKTVEVRIWKSRKNIRIPITDLLGEIPTTAPIAALTAKSHNLLIPSTILEVYCGHVSIRTTDQYISFWPSTTRALDPEAPRFDGDVPTLPVGEMYTLEQDLAEQKTEPHYVFQFNHLNDQKIEEEFARLQAKPLLWDLIPDRDGVHNCCSISAHLLRSGGFTSFPTNTNFLTPYQFQLYCNNELAPFRKDDLFDSGPSR